MPIPQTHSIREVPPQETPIRDPSCVALRTHAQTTPTTNQHFATPQTIMLYHPLVLNHRDFFQGS